MPNFLDGNKKCSGKMKRFVSKMDPLDYEEPFLLKPGASIIKARALFNVGELIHDKAKDLIILTLDTVQSTIFLCNQGTHKLSFPLQSKHQTNWWYFQQFWFRFPGHFSKLRKPCLTTKGNLVLKSCLCSYFHILDFTAIH